MSLLRGGSGPAWVSSAGEGGVRAGGPRCAPDASGYSGEVIASVRGREDSWRASLGRSLWAQEAHPWRGRHSSPEVRISQTFAISPLSPFHLLEPTHVALRLLLIQVSSSRPTDIVQVGVTLRTGSTRTELECQLGPQSPHSVSFPFPIHPWEASWPPRSMDSSGSQAPACLPTSQLPPQGLRCPVPPLSLCLFVSYCDWHSEEY